jgi:hypothetical protein
VRDYLKSIKRGYGRTAHLTSIDIRNGRMSRDEALKMIRNYDGKRPASLDLFLKYIGLDEEDFMDIAMSHQVSPYQHDPSRTVPAAPLPDQPQWDQTIELLMKEP